MVISGSVQLGDSTGNKVELQPATKTQLHCTFEWSAIHV